jgi:hypothetical protein
MRTKKSWQLAAMMGLVCAVQGSYWPLLAVHLVDLGIQGRARGWIFATLASGTKVAPLGAGQLLDRVIPTQRFLALVYAFGTGLLWILASGSVAQPVWLFVLFLAYWSLIGPAVSLANSLALRNLDDAAAYFGWVRPWGTTAWIMSGWLVSMVMAFSGSTRACGGAFEAIWVATALSWSSRSTV